MRPVCEKCGKSFCKPWVLARHKDTVKRCARMKKTKDNDKKCNTCGQVFCRPDVLKKHKDNDSCIRSVNLPIKPRVRNVPKYPCIKCGIKCTRKDSLRRHQKRCFKKAKTVQLDYDDIINQITEYFKLRAVFANIEIAESDDDKVEIEYVVRDDRDGRDLSNPKYLDFVRTTIPILDDKNRSNIQSSTISEAKFKTKEWRIPASSAVFAQDKYHHDIHLAWILDILGGFPIKPVLVDLYFQILMDEYIPTQHNPHTTYVPSLFFPYHEKEEGWKEVREEPYMRCGPQDHIHRTSIVIAPMYAFRHFYLVYYDFGAKKAFIMDPLWTFLDDFGKGLKRDIRQEQTLAQLKHLIINFSDIDVSEVKEWNVKRRRQCQQQRDTKTCGLQIIAYAESILKGDKSLGIEGGRKSKKIMGKTTLKSLQQKVFIAILKTSEFGRDVLKYICK